MDLNRVSSEVDVLIVGGGIVGCGILRDLALNQRENGTNIKILLVDKGDFNSQTSQGSSKMLHGGIRYLENFDFSLVHEALQEKNLWLKLAPHLCYEDSFHLPVYKSSKFPLFFIRLGMFLYDFLSHFKNSPHKILNKQKTLLKLPALNPDGLRGCGVYYDAIVDDAKLGLECLYDALMEDNVRAMNYTQVNSFKNEGDVSTVELEDTLTHNKKIIKARHVIFATGPFTDKLFEKLNIPWKPKLIPSKGIHLWLKPESINIKSPVVLQTKDDRVIFVIPQRGAILAGTTESIVTEEIYNIKPSESEIDYLLKEMAIYFPHANLNRKNIISSFAAVRPLVKEDSGNDLGKTSRVHKIYYPYSNVEVIIGGKYTTFRIMAQDMSRIVMRKLGLPYHEALTLSPLRQHSVVETFSDTFISHEDLKAVLKKERVKTIDDLLRRRFGLIHPEHPRLKDIKDKVPGVFP